MSSWDSESSNHPSLILSLPSSPLAAVGHLPLLQQMLPAGLWKYTGGQLSGSDSCCHQQMTVFKNVMPPLYLACIIHINMLGRQGAEGTCVGERQGNNLTCYKTQGVGSGVQETSRAAARQGPAHLGALPPCPGGALPSLPSATGVCFAEAMSV